jgi:lipoprotein-anchoring transpeptidase ErfK/SrfK
MSPATVLSHGTWDTNSIGKQATAGCIRLLNGDIAELYTILPVGTTVVVHE